MAAPRWLTDDQQRTWRVFIRLLVLLDAQLDRDLRREHGLAHAYYQILAMLSEAPEWTLRMSELASITQYSPSRLSHAMTRLEADGLVCRVQAATDRRGQNAVLTDKGWELVVVAAPDHVDGVRRHVFDPLTDEQVTQLFEIATAINDTLEGFESPPPPQD